MIAIRDISQNKSKDMRKSYEYSSINTLKHPCVNPKNL